MKICNCKKGELLCFDAEEHEKTIKPVQALRKLYLENHLCQTLDIPASVRRWCVIIASLEQFGKEVVHKAKHNDDFGDKVKD